MEKNAKKKLIAVAAATIVETRPMLSSQAPLIQQADRDRGGSAPSSTDDPLAVEKGALLSLNASDDRRSRTEPPDTYRAVYLIFYLLGLGTLLPWNFFITAQGYWMYKFRALDKSFIQVDLGNGTVGNSTVTSSYRSDLQRTFTSYLSVCSMVPNVCFLMLNTILSRRIPLRLRLVGSLVVVIALFIVTTALVKAETDDWQGTFFTVTLLTVVILNCMTAIFQGALFGVAGIFPSRITQAIMNGQALGGVFAAVASILSLLAGSSDLDSAFSYFLAAVVTLIVSVFAFFSLTKFEFYNYHLHKQSDTELSSPGGQRSKSVPFLYIFKKIKIQAISVCLVFTVTLSVFPAVTVLVVSNETKDVTDWNKKFFIPVGCFLIYNLGDYMGRMAAGWHDLPKTKIPLLPILCAARIAFIPLLMFCNAQPRQYTDAVFSHDAWFLLFMLLFSLSSGFLASQAMIHGPKEAEAEHQEAAGAMMAFFLGLGLMTGAALSNVFVRLV